MAADATEQTSTAGTVIAGTVYAGTIEQLGRKSDGSRRVVFRTSSSAFDTQWPKWAYQIAMAAFLYDKQVQVVADEVWQPFLRHCVDVQCGACRLG